MHSYTLSNWDGSSTKKRESAASPIAQMQVFGSIPESSSASTTGQAIAHGIQLDASGLIVDEGGGDQVKRLDHELAEINDADDTSGAMFRASVESDSMSLDSLFDDQTQAQTTKKIVSTATVHIHGMQPNTRTQIALEGQANGTQANVKGRNGKSTTSGNTVKPDSVSLNGLFDEDVSVTLASPIAKRSVQPRGTSSENKSKSPILARSLSQNSDAALSTRGARPGSERGELQSLYSIDAEGEDEDENVEVIDLTKSPPPGQKRALSIDQARKNAQSARPRSPSLDPFAGLFTPPPERPLARSKRKKKNWAFVDIPPLRKGTRKKYKRMILASRPPRLPPPPPPPPPPPANVTNSIPQYQVHATLADALAAAMQSNDAALGEQETTVPPPSAGPPSSKAPSLPTRIPKRQISKDADWRPTKKPRTNFNKSRDPPPAPRPAPAPKPRHVLADITPPKPRPPPTFLYDPKSDSLQLLLTRRNFWLDTLPSKPWIVRPRGKQSDDEYSVGGLWSDDDSSEEEDDDDGFESEESFGDSKPQEPVAGPSSTPPRVNLAQMIRQKPLSAKKQRPVEGTSPSFPSQKALGKRRADPLLPNPLSPSTMVNPGAFVSRSPYNDNIVNQYLHSLPTSPMHPPMVRPSITQQTQNTPIMKIYRNPHAPGILLSSLNSPSFLEDSNNPSSGSRLMGVDGVVVHAHPEDDIVSTEDHHSPFLTNPDMHLDDLASAYSMTTIDPHHHNPAWGSGLESGHGGMGGQAEEEGYYFDTINPTLLQLPGDFVVDTTGGIGDDGQWDVYLADQDDDDDDEQDGEDGLVVPRSQKQKGKEKRARSMSYSDSVSSSSSSSSSTRSSSPDVPLSQKTPEVRQPPKQKRAHRFDLGNMPAYNSDSDDEDWNGSDGGAPGKGKRKTKKRKADHADSGESDDEDEDGDNRGTTSRTTTLKKGPPPKANQVFAVGPPKDFKWEMKGPDTYCHQCRGRSMRTKMRCDMCGKDWCNRCIAVRYPETVFAATFELSNPCFRCTNTCNCDLCCKKRGEEFVSSARVPRQANAIRATSRPSRKLKSASQPAASSSNSRLKPLVPVEIPTDFLEGCGPVYGLDGSKITTVHVEYVPPELEEEYLSQRTFVGVLQPSWGMKPDVKVVDLDTLEDDDVLLENGARSKPQQRRKQGNVRMYVGKQAMLYVDWTARKSALLNIGESDSDSDGEGDQAREGEGDEGGAGQSDPDEWGHMFSSPLTVLSDIDSEKGDSEILGSALDSNGSGSMEDGIKRFSPEDLEPKDIARAFSLSLSACGLSVNPSPAPSVSVLPEASTPEVPSGQT